MGILDHVMAVEIVEEMVAEAGEGGGEGPGIGGAVEKGLRFGGHGGGKVAEVQVAVESEADQTVEIAVQGPIGAGVERQQEAQGIGQAGAGIEGEVGHFGVFRGNVILDDIVFYRLLTIS